MAGYFERKGKLEVVAVNNARMLMAFIFLYRGARVHFIDKLHFTTGSINFHHILVENLKLTTYTTTCGVFNSTQGVCFQSGRKRGQATIFKSSLN